MSKQQLKDIPFVSTEDMLFNFYRKGSNIHCVIEKNLADGKFEFFPMIVEPSMARIFFAIRQATGVDLFNYLDPEDIKAPSVH